MIAIKKILLFSILTMGTTLVLSAQQTQAAAFKFFGARPAGMGGAFVAVAEGSLAQYWNPAGLGVNDPVLDIRIPVGATIELTKDLLEKADNLSNLADKIDRIQGKSGSSSMDLDDYNDFVEILDSLNALNQPGLGILGEAHAGITGKIWKFALSANNYSEFSAKPGVDLLNINLIDDGDVNNGINAAPGFGAASLNDSSLTTARDTLASVVSDIASRTNLETGGSTAEQAANAIINEAKNNGATNASITNKINDMKATHTSITSGLPASGSGSFDDNSTNLTLRGASIWEIAFGLGGSFSFQKEVPILADMLFGGNMKIMKGTVGYGTINVQTKDADIRDVADEMKNNQKESTRISVDLGILYDKKKDWNFRSGILLRNITSPSFAAAPNDPENKKFNADAQIRFGLAYWPLDRWTIAADMDITENKTALSSYNSRLLSLGTEFKLLNSKLLDLALRTGLYKNMAESDSALAYTAGLGLTTLHVNMDIGGAISSKSVKTKNGNSIPASFGVSASMSVTF